LSIHGSIDVRCIVTFIITYPTTTLGSIRILLSEITEPLNLGTDEMIDMNDFAKLAMSFVNKVRGDLFNNTLRIVETIL